MTNLHTTTTTGDLPVDRQPIPRDPRGLLDALTVIDGAGWDSEPASALLTFIRNELVRPLTIDIGLRGGAASQAEATAWEAVWLKLCDRHLRSASSPWGVIWQTARRAVLGEVLAARWGTDWRRAWEHDAEERAGRRARPISLEPLLSRGTEPATPESTRERTPPTPVSLALDLTAGALADSGWDPTLAKEIVAQVAAMDDALSHGATVVGWRPLATRLGLPPWQARRLTFVLRGSVDRPGLLARLITDGPDVAAASEVREAIAGTLTRTRPSPTRRPGSPEDRPRPQGLASRPCPHLDPRPATSSASLTHT